MQRIITLCIILLRKTIPYKLLFYWSVLLLCVMFYINVVLIILHFNKLRMGCEDCITTPTLNALMRVSLCATEVLFILALAYLASCLKLFFIMRNRLGEYGLEGDIWVMTQHEESKNFYFELNIVINSKLSPFIFEILWSDLWFCVEDWDFLIRRLKGTLNTIFSVIWF